MSDVGIVVDGFGISHQPVLDFGAQANLACAVVINEKEKLANPMQQFTQVYYRDVHDDDVFNHADFDARNFVHNLSIGLAADVGLYLGNEPGESLRLIETTCDAMEVCLDIHRKAIVFNFSVQHPSRGWWLALQSHERFNRLYHPSIFKIGGHQYYTESIANGIETGTLLQADWLEAHQRYGVIFTEYGYAQDLDPHAGQVRPDDLDIFVHNPDFRQHHIPTCVFIWNDWHGFGFGQNEEMKQTIIRLNQEEEELYHLTWKQAGSDWKVRSGKGTDSPVLAVIDIDTTPVQLLDLSGGWYHVYVPSLKLTGYMYAYGISGIEPVGFKKV